MGAENRRAADPARPTALARKLDHGDGESLPDSTNAVKPGSADAGRYLGRYLDHAIDGPAEAAYRAAFLEAAREAGAEVRQ